LWDTVSIETSKAYWIYVPGQRYIEVNRDATFDEEVAFCRSRELPSDTVLEEQEAPTLEGPVHESSHSDEQREEAREPSIDLIEEPIGRLLEAPPTKRMPSWCREIL
jgi:hypothetical protein